MGERDEIPTDFQPQKCDKRSIVGNVDDDIISRLPDDILVNILSLLSLKESARTSLFSTRWRNLWKHTPSLNFDAESYLDFDEIEEQPELFKSERSKYVKWVNAVIQSHKSLTLQEFKIHFELNKSFRKAITRWLEFAFSKHVQRLDMDLENRDRPFHYCIPDELLIRSCSTASKSLVGFKSLKALSLKSVGVSNGAIELLLDNCPLLEQLIVHRLVKISKLEICGSSLMLKDVEIDSCHSLESIKVSLPRLTTLTISHVKGLLLENVPMLVNVSVWSHDDNISMENLFDALSCCISQLETLILDLFNPDCSRREKDELCALPQMPKLKKLVVEYGGRGDESLVRLAALLMVSPYLEEFVFKFNWFDLPREDREVKDAVRIPYHHLKVFKFCGYYGSTNDVELVRYVLENCAILEKMIIDPSCYYPEEEQTARRTAKQKLAPQVAEHINLVIL